jgi:hypothetical protein
MCAFDRPKGYDYFRITAGHRTLADAYRDRTHSTGRISRAMSPYRDMS